MSIPFSEDKKTVYKYILSTIEDEALTEAPTDKTLIQNAGIADLLKQHGKNMDEHSKHYGNILSAYSKNVERTLSMKRKFKIIFFVFALASLLFTSVVFYLIVNKAFNYIGKGYSNFSIISTLLSAVISIITVYNVIPQIIAEYLFNKEEDKTMTDYVSKIQGYDSSLMQYIFSEEPNTASKEDVKEVSGENSEIILEQRSNN